MEGASAWGSQSSGSTVGPYAPPPGAPAPMFQNLDPIFSPAASDTDLPEVFDVEIADMHSIVRELYREVMSIKHNVALARADIEEHVRISNEKHEEYRREFEGASRQLTHVQNLVNTAQQGAPAHRAPSPGPAPNQGVARAPPPVPGVPKLKIATPKPFGGKESEAKTFQVNCTMYIQGTSPQAPEDQKIATIISYMEGDARDWLQTFLEYDLVVPVPWLHNLAQFWNEFQGRFGEIDREEKNRAKFNKLKQGSGSIQDYQRDFQRYAVGLQYGDHALRDKFYDGLNDNIKTMMIQQMFDPYAATSNLQSVATRAVQIYNKLQLLKATSHTTPVQKSSSAPTTVALAPVTPRTPRERLNVGDPVYMIGQDGRAKKGKIASEGRNARGATMPNIKWSTGETSMVPYSALKKDSRPAVTSSPQTKPDPKGPGPMELDGRGRPQVVCNSCGGKGHFARVCPSRPMSGHAAQVGEEPLITIDSDDEESGKGDAKTQ